jgi:hypothetical protein
MRIAGIVFGFCRGPGPSLWWRDFVSAALRWLQVDPSMVSGVRDYS